MDKPNVTDEIIDRAVDLWCRSLRSPKFDNGDNSFAGVLGGALQAHLAEVQTAKVHDFDAAIERFREALAGRLKLCRDRSGELDGGKHPDGSSSTYYFNRSLGVDYGPDRDLAAAAEAAGIPRSAFSIKSRVSFYGDNYVSASFGYGQEETNHYPLPDGRWLVCKLSGGQMPLIIQAVLDGRLPELHVE